MDRTECGGKEKGSAGNGRGRGKGRAKEEGRNGMCTRRFREWDVIRREGNGKGMRWGGK